MTSNQPDPSMHRYRERVGEPRLHRINLRLQEDEYQTLTEAARGAGLTPAGYAAAAALAAARQRESPAQLPLRQALLEVIAARVQVRRFGVNVNQAVAALNTTGEPPGWLLDAVAITTRAVLRLDAAAGDLTRKLR